MPMYVERVDESSPFGGLKWDTLLAGAACANVFLTRPWLETWQQHQPGQELYVLAVRDQSGRLIGLAPLVRCKNRVSGLRELAFLGSGEAAADHLDFVAEDQQRTAVAIAICEYLRAHSEDWDVLRLTDIRQDSPTPRILQQQFKGSFVCRVTDGATCPYLPLEGSWQKYLDQKSSNFRQQTRSKRRKFERLPRARFVSSHTTKQVEDALQRLFHFNPQRWASQGESSAFSSRAFQECHLEVARRFLSEGWLDLCCLQVEDQTVAVLYSFVFADRVFYYNAGFDPRWSHYSLGRVLMAYHLESAFDRGLIEYDFLRGNHSYKYAWTSQSRCNRDVMVLQRNPKTLGYDRLQRGLKLMRRTMKQHLPNQVRHRLKHLLPSS